jgi:hypothetical protein
MRSAAGVSEGPSSRPREPCSHSVCLK